MSDLSDPTTVRRRTRDAARRITLLAVLLAATLATAQTPLDDAVAPLAELGRADAAGLVAFITPDGRPAVVDPTSGARVRLDAAPQRAQFPTWSPDGDGVTVIAVRADGPGLDHYRLDAAGFERRYVDTAAGPIYHGWSPDGARIALLTSGPGQLGLRLVDVAAGTDGAARLVAEGAPFYWDWSPDGGALLWHRNVLGDGAELALVPLDDALERRDVPAPGAFQSPAVSPSGAWLAYASRDGGDTRRVVLERLDGEGERRELTHTGLAAVAWHPRRDLVAIQRALVDGPHSYGPLVLIDAETGDLERLTDDLSIAFWFAPDGGTIAYLTPVAGGAPGSERQVLERVQALPRFSLRVVDVATGLRRELAVVTPSLLFTGQYLPFFDQYARSHRLWSPQSDALVLPVMVAGVSVIQVFGLDGSVSTLGSGDMPAWNVR